MISKYHLPHGISQIRLLASSPQNLHSTPHLSRPPMGPTDDAAVVAARSVVGITGHLNPMRSDLDTSQIERLMASSSMKDAYQRIHGEVSSEPIVWRAASDSRLIDVDR
ncbi:hypothetical protein Droror1_Dr00010047 [Drosera rotundifolia]